MELTILKRNFLQELIGSVTDRFAIVQGVYAAAPHAGALFPAATTTDTIGSTASHGTGWQAAARACKVVASQSGPLQSVGLNLFAAAGNIRTAIYADNGSGTLPTGAPLAESSSVAAGSGWNDLAVTGVSVVAGTSYWIAFQISSSSADIYWVFPGVEKYVLQSYGAFPTWSGALGESYTINMRITYSTGPPPSDFTITATPPSQSIGAGGTASSTLTVTAGGGFSGTVSLSVTSGCPSGVSCSVFPTSVATSGTATLSVPTLITTSGTYPVVVTATSGSLSHTATFTVTVTTSPTYNFNVRTGSTQVVVTVSWTGSGTSTVTIAGPSGTPTQSESGAVVYDRTTYQSGSSTPTNIHRVTFTLSSPPTGAWTAYVSQSGGTVTIEVS